MTNTLKNPRKFFSKSEVQLDFFRGKTVSRRVLPTEERADVRRPSLPTEMKKDFDETLKEILNISIFTNSLTTYFLQIRQDLCKKSGIDCQIRMYLYKVWTKN